jgi:hypothetical protein
LLRMCSLSPSGDLRLPFIPQILGILAIFVKSVEAQKNNWHWYDR